MLRKFYIFEPKEQKPPLVAALGYFNTKAFETACRNRNIRWAAISEEQARTALERSNGVGVGVYTKQSAIEAPEALKRELARSNRKVVAELVGCLTVEPVIELEPVRHLIVA